MQFIPIANTKSILRKATAYGIEQKLYDTNGDLKVLFADSGSSFDGGKCDHLIYSRSYTNKSLSSITSDSSNVSAQYIVFLASEDDNLNEETQNITDIVGTTTSTITPNSKGWIADITVSGSQEDTIRSLYAVRKFKPGGGSGGVWYTAVIFALKLDSPVELNAENNYTANFTFAIEF